MKKMIAYILALAALFTLSQPALAARPISVGPQYINARQAEVDMVINSSGVATATVICYGNTGLTKANVTTYIEKLVGGSWVRVNIGETNNAWQYTTTSQNFSKTYTAQLSSSGTYRAVAEFTLTASAVEHITSSSSARY